jgi:uncharacterized protein (UPF0333 family)
MDEDPLAPREPPGGDEKPMRSRGGSVVFALVALALILAIAFFYLTNERRQDRQADKLTQAAGAVDNAAAVVGDAAEKAADQLRNRN